MIIKRVNTLPAVEARTASTMYIVKSATDPDIAEIHFTNSDASATYRVVDRNDIRNLIAQVAGSTNTFEIAPTIAARNALQSSYTRNTLVLVTDATGDPTVTTGTALYAFNHAGQTWTKLTEYESLDLSLNWANISGRPNSSPEAIDAAVGASHSHGNKAVLDKLSEAGGQLNYNGAVVGNVTVSTSDW